MDAVALVGDVKCGYEVGLHPSPRLVLVEGYVDVLHAIHDGEGHDGLLSFGAIELHLHAGVGILEDDVETQRGCGEVGNGYLSELGGEVAIEG